jgi:hypothetical protein
MMRKSIYMVFTEPIPGREDEFNDWYEREHIPDVLRVKGIVAATRYEMNPLMPRSEAFPPARYLAIYELDGDPGEILGRLSQAGAAGEMRMTSAMASEHTTSFIFTPLSAPSEPNS